MTERVRGQRAILDPESVEFLAEVTGPKCSSTSDSSVVLESVRENAGSDFLLNIHDMVFTNYLPLLSRSEEECFHFHPEENLPSTAGAWQGVGRMQEVW